MVTVFSFLIIDFHGESRSSLISPREEQCWLLSILSHILLPALPLHDVCVKKKKNKHNYAYLLTNDRQVIYFVY